ncbi:lamin tail domain-containing protein, partial [Candidatus Latescibacterota bacterium]
TEQVMPVLQKIKSMLEPEMPRHIARWTNTINSMSDWYDNVAVLEEFAEKRPYYARLNLVSEFNLSDTANVTLVVSQFAAGKIKINTLDIEEYPWAGTYFQDVPVKLTALPSPGYKFTGWSGVEQTDSASITVTLTEDTSVTAHFEEDSTAINTIVINEINYNSSNDFNPEDWVELYNAYDIPVDISGWVFKDGDDAHIFIIPDNTVIAAGDYLVLCRDDSLFHAAFPEVDNYIANFNFGLSNAGETVRLFNSQGAIVDSLTYDDEAPWPVEPDGNGPTLALRNPSFDNAVPENWTSSIIQGTPGKNNDVFLTDTIVINEINYNSSDDFNPDDWVELYNKYDIAVDISGWVFKDEDEVSTFVFPENTIMESGDFLVVSRDTLLFHEIFPDVDNCIGNFDFGLCGGGETIYLYNTYGEIVDSVSYDDEAPWPVEPDGNGPTLALRNPTFDNAVPENWTSSITHGTPGKINDVFNTGVIVINEINYNSSDGFNPEDWVELYNPQDSAVDISGWIFKDEDEAHAFVIPKNTIIAAGDYFVLCRDNLLFHALFPEVDNYTGSFGFGLAAAGELIRLFNNHSDLVDSLTYDDEVPWPVEPDGNGPTLGLRNPELDNTLPESWASSGEYGTPGEINDVYSEDPSLPAVFSLGQNYPNPFNKMTTIPLYVPESCRVTIEVYSILGRRVAKILDEKMLTGDYNIVFKPDNLASGIYFYSIKAGKFNKTKQMVFIK